MTIGQLSFYDQVKLFLLASGYFDDNIITHFTASTTAVRYYYPCSQRNSCKIDLHSHKAFFFLQGAVATTLCQPLDVLKTRAMNAKPGEFRVSVLCPKERFKD